MAQDVSVEHNGRGVLEVTRVGGHEANHLVVGVDNQLVKDGKLELAGGVEPHEANHVLTGQEEHFEVFCGGLGVKDGGCLLERVFVCRKCRDGGEFREVERHGSL